MNNKKNRTKSISVALLVALAAFATTGLVLADHIVTVEGVPVTSQTYFNQYQAAIEHMEEDQTAAVTALSVSKVNSRDVFGQYAEAIEQMEREKNAALTRVDTRSQSNLVPYLDAFEQTHLDRKLSEVTSLVSVDTRSGESFEQYLDAFDQMEREKNAALTTSHSSDADDSMLFWEQYFKYAK